ncbi:MAG: GTPase [Anaerolineaceae bacterium]
MTSLDNLIKQFPPDVQNTIRQVWENLNPDERTSLLSLATSLPGKTDLMKILVKSSTDQIRQTFGKKHSVAIVGPANVGKSTLYNQFINNRRDRANVSPIPGTTARNQAALSALFTIVDTPGADSVGEKGQQERSQAFAAAEYADFLVLVFDAIQGIKRGEQQLFNEMLLLGKPFVVVLNKIDLIPGRDVEKVTALAANNLGLQPGQMVAISAKDGRHLEKVLLAIATAEPRLIAALGRALPEYRWQLAWRSIISAASVSGAIALTPLPVIDFIPLVATQSVMVLGIARIYDYDITPKRAAELIATFGLGFLGKTLFQQLSKLGSLPGWLLSAAIASSTTVAMGYAAVQWFDKGQRLSSEALKRITENVASRQLSSLMALGKHKPGSQSLQQRITDSLENSDLAGTPQSFEAITTGDKK